MLESLKKIKDLDLTVLKNHWLQRKWRQTERNLVQWGLYVSFPNPNVLQFFVGIIS